MQKRLKCACGWEITGTDDEVIAAVQQHAEQLHNMQATREEILSRLEPAPEP
jgi:predicted small metal-binding protein